MKVLITDFDLFAKTGGGQAVYRRLLETHPYIDFYYFIREEADGALRPANAHGLRYIEPYSARNFLGAFQDLTPPHWTHWDFEHASNFAASVAGQHFDVVETPDYEQHGYFLGPALRSHGVKFGRVTLSLHGRISTTVRLDWGSDGALDHALDLREQLQYRAVDTRYGISRSYIDEWRALTGVAAHYLHPLRFLKLPEPILSPANSELPSLNFVGRTEKRKGPDIFVDLVWWLPKELYRAAYIIGPDSYDAHGIGSGLRLYTMINNRLEGEIVQRPAMKPEELDRLFASRAMVFLPSRYDTLNLLALESLLAGCPTAIGNGAGVCRFLRENYPEVPFVSIDIHDVYACLPELEAVLRDYDSYRQCLVRALIRSKPVATGLTLEEIYQAPPRGNPETAAQADRWYSDLMRFHEKLRRSPRRRMRALGVRFASALIPGADTRRAILAWRPSLVLQRWRSQARDWLVTHSLHSDARFAEQVSKLRFLPNRYREIYYASEHTTPQLNHKIQLCWNVATEYRLDRARFWSEIARVERLHGNDLVAATYELRVMRLLGEDRLENLPKTAAALEAHGYVKEAQATQAMYGGTPAQRLQRCGDLLDQARRDHSHNPDRPYEFVDDRRSAAPPKVAIVVSLYNAAPKLPHFLKSLHAQTLLHRGEAEIILIDTGSPADEYAVFQNLWPALKLPTVYARSYRRETIQSAWNRGIGLARAPYLAFLGVDEGILPDTLETLAGELEADSTLDWVQGNSLVTQVDKNGSWVHDIMIYNRTGYRQDLVYLETCYLSWVGALYRRSLHDRFGYYDASFGAAGDTEFKNRVLPLIKTKFIPRTLGVFWNYADDRMTQSPRAEIEDMRAWYLHRTLAGMRYAFARRNPHEAEALLYACLRYRKSYCQHWSTDLDLATVLVDFLQQALPDSPALRYADGIRKVQDIYRALEWMPKLLGWSLVNATVRARRHIAKIEQQQRDWGEVDPLYQIFNDNRHEQHSFLWKDEPENAKDK